MFGNALKNLLAESKVSANKINLAIDRHKMVVVRYNTHGQNIATADRLVGVFAYGQTKRGNDVIRVFEYEGDTSTFIPGWKFLRVDRIISWRETRKTIDAPPQNTGVGEFNQNGDNSMSVVYKIAKFGGTSVPIPKPNEPAMSNGGKTPEQQEKERIEAQKTKIGIAPFIQGRKENSNEPKMSGTVKTPYGDKPLMKTDTERRMEYLRQQLNNPEKIDLSNVGKKKKEDEPKQNEPTMPDTVKTPYGNKPLTKTDTERRMEYLRQQLNNPEKIDLTKVPKK